jgi:hypothetical protein
VCPILSHIILSYLIVSGTAALIIQYFQDPKYWKTYCNPDYFLCSSGTYIRALTVILMFEDVLSKAINNTSTSRGEMSTCNWKAGQGADTPECVFLCVCIYAAFYHLLDDISTGPLPLSIRTRRILTLLCIDLQLTLGIQSNGLRHSFNLSPIISPSLPPSLHVISLHLPPSYPPSLPLTPCRKFQP